MERKHELVAGWVFTAITVAIPLYMWHVGFHETLMLGAAAGMSVRGITDMSLLHLRNDEDGSGLDQYDEDDVPSVALAIALQFGALLGAIIYAFGGNTFAIGYVGATFIMYLLVVVGDSFID